MSKIFVTSDTWFNRPMIDEPSVNVWDNNELIINNWNNTVSPEDKVYVLGGFGIADLYSIVVRLNGEIHFLDNYFTKDEKNFMMDLKMSIDKTSDPKLKEKIIFEDCQVMSLNDLDVIISYFPLFDWCGFETGTFNLHGFNNDSELFDHRISCVSSKNGNKPIDVEDICQTISKFEKQF